MDPISMFIDHSTQDSIHFIIHTNSLTHDLALELKSRIKTYLAESPRPIVLDLSRVQYIDSSGIGMLLLLKQILIQQKQVLTVPGIQGPLEETFRQMHLLEVFRPSNPQ